MKILYGITKSNLGGAQRYVYDLALEAKRLGHDVVVLCGGNGVLVEKLREKQIRIISLNNLKRDIKIFSEFSSLFQIMKVLREEKPDVFHINSSKMGGLGALAGRLTGIKKIIFTSHGWEFNAPRPLWQRIVIKFFSWLIVLLAHKTISVSEKTKADIASLPFASKRINVIRNGVESFLLETRERSRDKLNLPKDTFIVGTIAELHKVKGLDVLLEAWAKFKKTKEGILVLIGGGEEDKNLKKTAQNKGVLDSVFFLGFIPDARTFLSAFDIFVLPSRSEALPYAPLEAGFAGLPVVASSVGGVPEIIDNGVNGILVPKEDAVSLVSSLILLEENPELRNRLGNELKKTVDTKFSRKKMLEETFSIYSL